MNHRVRAEPEETPWTTVALSVVAIEGVHRLGHRTVRRGEIGLKYPRASGLAPHVVRAHVNDGVAAERDEPPRRASLVLGVVVDDRPGTGAKRPVRPAHEQ